MGLLDALFSSDSYGGQGGGLLDLIRQTQGQNTQYQPSAGFSQQPASFADRFNAVPNAPQPFQGGGGQFDQANYDPQTFAPNQAQPISVGSNYQMPRMGAAPLFAPQMANADPAAIPPNAQPAQGQLPQGQPAPSQAPQQQPEQPLPPAFGGASSILGRLGNPDGLIARLTGNDTRSQTQQNLKAQYDSLRQALIANGETPQAAASKAMVAAMNPEAAKTIIPELFTNKEKYGVISEDPFAGKKYGFINERDQTVNGKRVDAQGATGSSSPLVDMENAKAAGVQGDALYQYLPKQIAPMVKAMVEGRQPLPTGAAMRNPATLALIDAAHSVDPSFDATVWKARNEAGPDWSKGKSSEMVRAANQTLGHVDSLMNAMDALKNRGMPAWNAVANTVSEQFGTGEQGSFRTNAHAVAEEMSKVFKGANLSDSEIRHWEQNLSENMSPTQQKAQIAKLSELLHGSLVALEKKRTDALGPAAAAKAPPIIGEEGLKVLKRVEDWTKENPPESAKKSALPAGWTVKVN